MFLTKLRKDDELKILLPLSHPNIIRLIDHFYTPGYYPKETYINLVIELVPCEISKVIAGYKTKKLPFPPLLAKVYGFQLFRAIAYLHSHGICHRDIKPANLLVNPETQTLKICDFGSAKHVEIGTDDLYDMCSRYYRAPELVLDVKEYTKAIDVWACGCIIGEMFTGKPLFPGEGISNQLMAILRVLGVPSKETMNDMKSKYKGYAFPRIISITLEGLLKGKAPDEAIKFLAKVLVYDPAKRPKAIDVLFDPFFDELRNGNAKLPDGNPLPNLFDFTEEERSQLTAEQNTIISSLNTV